MQKRAVNAVVILGAAICLTGWGQFSSWGQEQPVRNPEWHAGWHHGRWAGGSTGWGGPWAWGLSWSGPHAAPYHNPFCGQCQVTVSQVIGMRHRHGIFTFGGGLQAPNEGGNEDEDQFESVAIDYSRPLDAIAYFDQNADQNALAGAPPVSDASRHAVDFARGAFVRGNYNLALQYVNAALVRMPRDLTIHEFRALCLFALGRFNEAAITLNSLLAVGPGWNWKTMSGLYANVDVYTAHLRALEAYSKSNPQSPAGHFLLAYHYLADGYPDSGVMQLRQVVELSPRASVATQLLQRLSPSKSLEREGTALEQTSSSSSESPSVEDVSAPQLIGTWKATLPDGTKITTELDAKSNFTWRFNRRGKSAAMSGMFTLQRHTLTLKDRAAGTLAGHVSLAPDGALKFQVADAPANGGEIVFRR